jgi:hypothetical protein
LSKQSPLQRENPVFRGWLCPLRDAPSPCHPVWGQFFLMRLLCLIWLWMQPSVNVDASCPNVYDESASGRSGGRGGALAPSRKVRTLQGTTPGKSRDGVIYRIGPQKQCAFIFWMRVRVKRRCKRPPAFTAMWTARQPPSRARSSRDDGAARSF